MLKRASIYLTGHDLAKGMSGVGPNAAGYLRIIIPYQGLFFDAAGWHDVEYTRGGSEYDRERADDMFYALCYEKCNSGLQKSTAKLYYLCVRKYGKSFFNFRQKINK